MLGEHAKSELLLLLQDEPENDLDVETLRALEDALGSFAGAANTARPEYQECHVST